MLNFDANARAGDSEQEWVGDWGDEDLHEAPILWSTILKPKPSSLCVSERPCGKPLPARTEFPFEYISGFCAAG